MQKISEIEAIEIIRNEGLDALEGGGYMEFGGRLQEPEDETECCNAFRLAIKALEELILYKQGGLVLIPTDVFQRQCDELDAYKAIGTLDECREAVERMKPKSPTYDGDGYAPDGTFVWDEWLCPNCGSRYEVDFDEYDHCPNCGQAILREEAEAALEKMKGEEYE